MPIKKASKTHTSTRKKKEPSSANSGRAKKTASKRSQTRGESKVAAKSKSPKSKKAKKNGERPAWLKKRDELTLKMFQMVYEDYQQGKFHRIL